MPRVIGGYKYGSKGKIQKRKGKNAPDAKYKKTVRKGKKK